MDKILKYAEMTDIELYTIITFFQIIFPHFCFPNQRAEKFPF